MNESSRTIYMCRQCLRASDVPGECHGEPMVECCCGYPGDFGTRPVTEADGRIVTHAPRWWAEQTWATARRHG